MKNSSPESGAIRTNVPKSLMDQMKRMHREVDENLMNARFKRRGIKREQLRFSQQLVTERVQNDSPQYFKYPRLENKAYHSPQFEKNEKIKAAGQMQFSELLQSEVLK